MVGGGPIGKFKWVCAGTGPSKGFRRQSHKVAKPINLEASLKLASSSEAMDVDAPASASEDPHGWLINSVPLSISEKG